MSADGLAGAPLVENVVGEVVAQACAVLLCDRADQDTITVEELKIDGVSVRVVGVVEEQRVKGWGAGLVLLVDGCVDIVDWIIVSFTSLLEYGVFASLTKLISDGNALAGSLSDCWPAVEFLGSRGDLGVVPEESVEGAERCPSVVFIFVRVT